MAARPTLPPPRWPKILEWPAAAGWCGDALADAQTSFRMARTCISIVPAEAAIAHLQRWQAAAAHQPQRAEILVAPARASLEADSALVERFISRSPSCTGVTPGGCCLVAPRLPRIRSWSATGCYQPGNEARYVAASPSQQEGSQSIASAKLGEPAASRPAVSRPNAVSPTRTRVPAPSHPASVASLQRLSHPGM